MSSFIISHFSYCPLIWMFCSKKSTKKINAVHERSLRIIRNDYESLYPLLLEETHQITFHQQCINSLMREVYKYLNGHSLDIMSEIHKDIFACLFSIHNTISLSCHEQVCLSGLRFERYFSHHRPMINLLYYE